jgi:hypothetical protein
MSAVQLSTLVEAGRVLDAAGVDWWVTDGMCLSLVRSGRVEDWQQDVDVGVWDIWAATQALTGAGWPVRAKAHNQFKGAGMLDVTGHRRTERHVYADFPENVSYRFSAHLFDRFEHVTVDGHTFRVPSPVHDYLTEHYGDWRTPVKEWNWRKSPVCAVHR